MPTFQTLDNLCKTPEYGSLSNTARHLLTLFLYLGEESAQKTIPQLETFTGLSKATIIRASRELVESGFISKKKGIGRNAPNIYSVQNLPVVPTPSNQPSRVAYTYAGAASKVSTNGINPETIYPDIRGMTKEDIAPFVKSGKILVVWDSVKKIHGLRWFRPSPEVPEDPIGELMVELTQVLKHPIRLNFR